MSDSIREQVIELLRGGSAHADYESALAGVPAQLRGVRPPGSPHSLWDLMEHMRIAQWDILEFVRNPGHRSPEFPAGYWPSAPNPVSPEQWEGCVQAFHQDRNALIEMAKTAPDLSAVIAHGEGQTLLRELLLAADHNAYHLGQFVLVRKLLNAWPG